MSEILCESANPITSGWSSEVAWAAAAASGDSRARRTLVEHLLPRVRRTLSYLVKNKTETDDLTQRSMIQLLQSIHQFRGECTLAYWSDRVAIRTATKQFEKRNRREQLWKRLGANNHCSSTVVEPQLEEQTDQQRLRRRLAEVMSQLPAHNRVAIVLFYLHDYNIAEIAELTDCPVNTVRGRLKRGRKAIKKALELDPCFADWIQGRGK